MAGVASSSHFGLQKNTFFLHFQYPNKPSHFSNAPLLFQKPRRLRPLAIKGSQKDPNPKSIQDEEVKDLGVRAALSMLRFYKTYGDVEEPMNNADNPKSVHLKFLYEEREISPLLPSSCRYVPTCSEYSMEAYKKYGVAKGTILTAWRLCRCNPLGGSGFDPPRWFDEKKQPED